MRFFISFLVAIACCTSLAAQQAPKYQFTSYGTTWQSWFSINSGPSKAQTIYLPRDFPGMPAGPVQAVYFRMLHSSQHHEPTASYPRFRVQIGRTTDTAWVYGKDYDTFKTELTTLMDGPLTIYGTRYGVDTNGQWIRIPCNGRFSYDAKSPFVFELGRGVTADTPYGIGVAAGYTRVGNARKSIGGAFDSIRTQSEPSFVMMDLGIDIATTGVEALGNIASVGVFPNPASGSTVQVSLQAKQAVGRLSVRLLNLSGQVVRQAEFRDVGRDIFRSVDIAGLPAGMYSLELNADGEVLSRKLVLR